MEKELVKSYLGFTDGMTPRQKSCVVTQLDKWLRVDGECHKFKTFLPVLILSENWRPACDTITHGLVKDDWGRSYGELKTPHISYSLQKRTSTENVFSCISLNKTQYDYAVYIINTFRNYREVLEYDAEEQAKDAEAEKARIAEEEAKKQREAEEERKERNFQSWLAETAMQYVSTDAVSMTEKAFKRYGDTASGFWNAFKTLACIDNLDRDRCRRYLIEVLHNDNLCSIQLFKLYTGIKLPRSYKERIVFINKLNSSDIPHRAYDLSNLTTYKELMIDSSEKSFLGYEMYAGERNYYLRLTSDGKITATEEHGICVTYGRNAVEVIERAEKRLLDPSFTEKVNEILSRAKENTSKEVS